MSLLKGLFYSGHREQMLKGLREEKDAWNQMGAQNWSVWPKPVVPYERGLQTGNGSPT
jgi:hypothetical protein